MFRCRPPFALHINPLRFSVRTCVPRIRSLHITQPRRNSANEPFDPMAVERVEDEVDVCIVGGGPAGLSAAIRLKQLEREKGNEIRVVVLEKGGEVGSHILSGAVLEPRALNELLPDWASPSSPYNGSHPLTQPATSSSMLFFTPKHTIPIPHPPQMSNSGNYILSLSALTRWLASIAESHYGVEIYPGFAGAQLLYSPEPDAYDSSGNKVRSVQGVITNEVGLTSKYTKKPAFEPGMVFRSKVTLLAEGAHGSLSKSVLSTYSLRKDAQPQTYGIGLKEVWRVAPERYSPGKVVHTLGWPLGWKTYGGGWVYHGADGLVSLGLVVGLDYRNPYLSPYRELQRMKHHPYFRRLLSGPSTRLAYGARTLTEGGLQSVPTLHFPGGALIGCSAGFMNVAKIKGTHNAMKSGMLAAEAAYDALASSADSQNPSEGAPASSLDMSAYTKAFKSSWIHQDLHEVRNLRPSFNTRLGLWGGVIYSGIDSLLLKGRVPWTFKHAKSHGQSGDTRTIDSQHTEPASAHQPITYPPFEAPLSTDLMTSVALTGTNHAEDQPVHLRVMTAEDYAGLGRRGEGSSAVARKAGGETGARRREHVKVNVGVYAGLLERACPAGVYEYVDDDAQGKEGGGEGWDGKKLVINSQNCIHCKLCDIKVPTQDITWTVPEGGGGPKYSIT